MKPTATPILRLCAAALTGALSFFTLTDRASAQNGAAAFCLKPRR